MIYIFRIKNDDFEPLQEEPCFIQGKDATYTYIQVRTEDYNDRDIYRMWVSHGAHIIKLYFNNKE